MLFDLSRFVPPDVDKNVDSERDAQPVEKNPPQFRGFESDPGVTRTRNRRLRRPMLYPVELRGPLLKCAFYSE
jgi:hypothetical protein